MIDNVIREIDFQALLKEQLVDSDYYEWVEIWYDDEIWFIHRAANSRAMDERHLIGRVPTDRGCHAWMYEPHAWHVGDGTYHSSDGETWPSEQSLIEDCLENGDWHDHYEYLEREIRRTHMERQR